MLRMARVETGRLVIRMIPVIQKEMMRPWNTVKVVVEGGVWLFAEGGACRIC